jgi:hypothetical protein
VNGDPVPADAPGVAPANRVPATQADLRRLERRAQLWAEDARLDAVREVTARHREAVKAAGWALLVCTVAALVIWAWAGNAYRAVRRAWEAL